MLSEFGKASNDFAKAASNAIILTNGAAAIAILANSGKAPIVPAHMLMLTLVGYATGAILGTVMLLLMSLCNDAWDDPDDKLAVHYWNIYLVCFCFGAACFVVSSGLFGFGLAR
jgi:hypothetical protein